MISCKRINKGYIHLKNALLQLEENWWKKIPPLYPVMLWSQSASGLLCGETIWCSDACHTCCSAIDYIKLPLAHAISHIGKHVCCTGCHEKKKTSKKKTKQCMSTQLIFSNLLHIRKKNEADSVEKCFGFFFPKFWEAVVKSLKTDST